MLTRTFSASLICILYFIYIFSACQLYIIYILNILYIIVSGRLLCTMDPEGLSRGHARLLPVLSCMYNFSFKLYDKPTSICNLWRIYRSIYKLLISHYVYILYLYFHHQRPHLLLSNFIYFFSLQLVLLSVMVTSLFFILKQLYSSSIATQLITKLYRL